MICGDSRTRYINVATMTIIINNIDYLRQSHNNKNVNKKKRYDDSGGSHTKYYKTDGHTQRQQAFFYMKLTYYIMIHNNDRARNI